MEAQSTIICYLKISLWHGVTPVESLKKDNLTLSVNGWAALYPEIPSSFVGWHESVTVSLHKLQTLILIYPIRRVIHLDIHLLPKVAYQYLHWHSDHNKVSREFTLELSVSGTSLGVKTLLLLDLFAVMSRAYCRNIWIISSSFYSFKVDIVKSISGGFLGQNSRNLFIKSNVKSTKLYFKLKVSSSCVSSSIECSQVHLWNWRLCAQPHSIGPAILDSSLNHY